MAERAHEKRAKETLHRELKEAVGEEAVEGADLDLDRAISQRGGPGMGELKRSRLLIITLGAIGAVVALIVSLALDSWWLLAILLPAHALLTAVVVMVAVRLSTSVEKPDPSVAARLEDQGVPDPEGALNDLVEQTADKQPGSRAHRTLSEDAQETTEPQKDRAAATARQQTASTPSSEPTKTVGES